MFFDEYEESRRFREAWESVEIARPVHYSLFTFGESNLPYYLVCEPAQRGESVSVTRGEVKITRPTIVTPENARPEFRNFFEDNEGDEIVNFLLERTAAFSHLNFDNESGPAQFISDSVEEVVDRINQQLDDEEEDRVAILTAPANLGGVAILRYASESVWKSAPENLQELRERGFLP